jgi:hypothetical protein
MKIYLFDPETGIYLGEDFADEAPMKPGGYIIPPDVTTIPPPRGGQGQVPVFNCKEQKWEIRSLQHRDMKIAGDVAHCNI